jgi:lysine 2,3-aminomutase
MTSNLRGRREETRETANATDAALESWLPELLRAVRGPGGAHASSEPAASECASRTLRNTSDLIEAGLVPESARADLDAVARRHAIAITPAVAALIDPSDPDDPVARQFVPNVRELALAPGENLDPIGDDAFSPVGGVVHRYPDRVLLKLVNVCAVYCRFCFRREMVGPGKSATLTDAAYARCLAYIRARPEIWEVILTGGDPLMLSPRRLAAVMSDLAKIDHVKVVRIHTRIPTADPPRVNADLIRALMQSGKAVWIALHANHARELTDAARAACARLIDAGFPMLSQTVLLRGVNDDFETLSALMRALVECRIKPYYLHHGDMAPGTSHLRTTLDAGRELVRALRGRVSGLCQPEYVLDIPGGHGKVPAGAASVERRAEGGWRVTDYCGDVHAYDAEGKAS